MSMCYLQHFERTDHKAEQGIDGWCIPAFSFGSIREASFGGLCPGGAFLSMPWKWRVKLGARGTKYPIEDPANRYVDIR